MLRFFFMLLSLAPPLFGAVNSVSVSGSPSRLDINTAVAGQPPTSVQNTSTTYSVTTATLNRKIIGKLSSSMPKGVTLSIQLEASKGATSQGLVSMSTTSKNLVTGLPINLEDSDLQITYQLSATSAAVPASNVSRTVTFTIQ